MFQVGWTTGGADLASKGEHATEAQSSAAKQSGDRAAAETARMSVCVRERERGRERERERERGG